MNTTLEPSITHSPAPADPPDARTPDVHAYAEARTRLRSRVVPIGITTILLAVAGAADVTLAIPAFNGVLGQNPLLSFVCGVAFVAIAIGAAVNAGRELRHGNRVAVYAAGAAVLLLITGLLVLRITAAGINSSAAAFEGSTPTQNGALAEIPVAIVFAALMLATSILAAIDGYLLTVPRQVKNLRALGQEQDRLRAAIATTDAELTRHVENTAMAEARIEHLPEDLQNALDGLEAFARELQELARTEITRLLGSPTATSGLDNPSTKPATVTPRSTTTRTATTPEGTPE
ncbi:hypothetical protein [Microbacterium candidum]|uniref:Uncharacterized protein n=1 Tax=Microbacterium candidum TaxID=3041922 RepID=A0ABT7MW48_9MICO|nr:hypothetical protein [Microbacterium sp. ASV49]MDL9978645.1 hypothetical protein [Microbacterium sp. ASV49]